MPSHPIDFEINQDVFSTPEMRAIFDEKAVMQRWLDFEAALAGAQAELGIIPRDAAEIIAEKCRVDALDMDAVREGYTRSRNSVIPVLGALRKACGSAGQFVHYGATTQDVLDTGLVMGVRRAIDLIYQDLRRIEFLCISMSKKYALVPMVGRTHGQHALPVTFGLKVSVWAGEIRRHIQRIKFTFHNMRFGQLGGAVGTMAALGDRAFDVATACLGRLGLEHDPASWHTARDRMAECASVLAMASMTLSKVADEIFHLQETERGELSEPPPQGASSSTMPHKQNPVICQRVVSLSMHIRALSGTVLECMAHEHERDPRALWSEWLAMPQLCIYAGAVSSYMCSVLSNLGINASRMYDNLKMFGEFSVSEWLMFRLAESMGRPAAQAKVRELTQKAISSGSTLVDALLSDPVTGAMFERNDLAPLEKPELYTGMAEEIVQRVVSSIETERTDEPATLL